MGWKRVVFDKTGLATPDALVSGNNNQKDELLEPGHYIVRVGYVQGATTQVSVQWEPKSIVGAASHGDVSEPFKATAPPASKNILLVANADGTWFFTLSAPNIQAAGAGPAGSGPFPGGMGRWRVNVTGTPNATDRVRIEVERVSPPQD